jgi:hypothetical protein
VLVVQSNPVLMRSVNATPPWFEASAAMRYLVYSVRYSVVPINPSLVTVPLYALVITALMHNDTKYSLIAELSCIYYARIKFAFISGPETNVLRKWDARVNFTSVLPIIIKNFSSCLEFIVDSSYSITSIIRINWDSEPSGYSGSPDNWICL